MKNYKLYIFWFSFLISKFGEYIFLKFSSIYWFFLTFFIFKIIYNHYKSPNYEKNLRLYIFNAINFKLFNSRSNAKEVKDCFEGLNRATFAFNQSLDKVVFEPVAKGYRKLPVPIRTGTSNVNKQLI